MSEAVLSVFRGDATGGQEQTYKVPVAPGMVVLDAVHDIQARYAPDLACRWNCKAGHCGSCSAEINGKPRLMCKARLDQYKGQVIHVRPMKAFPVIKDLVTDVSWNYKVAKAIPPFAPPQGAKAPFTMYQHDVERSLEFRKCIECFLCQDVCHVIRDHQADYHGPRYMVKLASIEMHPIDTLNRAAFLKDTARIGFCNITKCCEEICPEHIHITDNAIIPLKERVASEFYDPLVWLLRRLTGSSSR